jgi:hypothetical protein
MPMSVLGHADELSRAGADSYALQVSFSASEKRVRDRREPIGRRVTCLHECLEQFNLFGFTGTRERLRTIVGAAEPSWTEQQVVAAMDLLGDAHTSTASAPMLIPA